MQKRSKLVSARFLQLAAVYVLAFSPCQGICAYVGPTELVVAQLGSSVGQVGFSRGDVPAYDQFPDSLLIASDGSMILPDEVNSKILVYKPDGPVRAEFTAKGLSSDWMKEEWPEATILLTDDTIVTQVVQTLQRYDLDGNLLVTAENIGGFLSRNLPDGTFLLKDKDSWHVYSSNLVFQKTLPTPPEDLSEGNLEVKERTVHDEEHDTYDLVYDLLISYTDRQYNIPDFPYHVESFHRAGTYLFIAISQINPADSYKYVYADGREQIIEVSHSVILQYDSDGNLVETLHLPADKYDPIIQVSPNYLVEPPGAKITYGEPIFDSYGNVYVWSIDATNYKILKWTRR